MADQMTIQAPVSKMTTTELLAALRAHYVPPTDLSKRQHGEMGESELLVEEVCAPGTNRRCDLLHVGVWQSRGQRLTVHELKVSRSDWLKELSEPAKAEAWWPYCHEFWIVAPDGVVDPTELPDGWGLMAPPANGRHRKFRVIKKAARKTPQIPASLLVEVARRVDSARLKQIANLNMERENAIYQAVLKERQSTTAKALTPAAQQRLKLLEELEEAIGARLDSYGRDRDGHALWSVSPTELGEALREYTPDHVALQRRIQKLERAAEALARGAERAMSAAKQAAGQEHANG